jgi:catechol 2,3-dioxygenase-like lactoylglutathione lyase family enzyme
MHVHIAVDDLKRSIDFYSALFAAQPSVIKTDYAKWMLDDPRINFAISQRPATAGLNHLGMQVESDEELEELHARLRAAEASIAEEKGVSCCYARSDKYWVTDPAGVAWESFRNLGAVEIYSDKSDANEKGCCGPVEETGARKPACCT